MSDVFDMDLYLTSEPTKDPEPVPENFLTAMSGPPPATMVSAPATTVSTPATTVSTPATTVSTPATTVSTPATTVSGTRKLEYYRQRKDTNDDFHIIKLAILYARHDEISWGQLVKGLNNTSVNAYLSTAREEFIKTNPTSTGFSMFNLLFNFDSKLIRLHQPYIHSAQSRSRLIWRKFSVLNSKLIDPKRKRKSIKSSMV
jgi:hypothetical protein